MDFRTFPLPDSHQEPSTKRFRIAEKCDMQQKIFSFKEIFGRIRDGVSWLASGLAMRFQTSIFPRFLRDRHSPATCNKLGLWLFFHDLYRMSFARMGSHIIGFRVKLLSRGRTEIASDVGETPFAQEWFSKSQVISRNCGQFYRRATTKQIKRIL